MDENGTTVSTAFGDVTLDDTTPDTGDETQQPEGESGAEAPAVPAEQKYRVGEQEYTASQLMELIEEAKNAKAMRREADRLYKEAKQTREDPELTELQRVRQLLMSNPRMGAEWQQMRKWLDGKIQSPQGGLAHIESRLQQFESRFAELDNMKNLEQSRTTLNGFFKMHNSIPGAAEWTDDSPEFLEFYDRFEEGTEPNDTDIEAYFWKTEGPKLLQSVATSARGQGKAEVEQAVKAGARASMNTTAPSGQRNLPYEGDASNPSWNDEIDAAVKDDAVFSKL